MPRSRLGEIRLAFPGSMPTMSQTSLVLSTDRSYREEIQVEFFNVITRCPVRDARAANPNLYGARRVRDLSPRADEVTNDIWSCHYLTSGKSERVAQSQEQRLPSGTLMCHFFTCTSVAAYDGQSVSAKINAVATNNDNQMSPSNCDGYVKVFEITAKSKAIYLHNVLSRTVAKS